MALAPEAPGAATGQVDLGRVPGLLARIRQVPDELRRFRVTAQLARRQHQIRPDLLDLLVAEGLPCVGAGGERLFDDYDIGNVALHLGLLSTRRMAMRTWATALRRAGEAGAVVRRVTFRPSCPAPGHPPPCHFDILAPDDLRIRRVGPGDGDGDGEPHTIEARLPARWPDVGPAVREVIDELREADFFLLPEAVRWDLDFLRRTGLTDCGGASRLLVEEGRRRGLAARFSFGLLVAKPYSTPHCWAEFRVDGIWVPVDPLMVNAMVRWGSLQPEPWPPHRSPGALFVRLASRFCRVVEHGGIWAGLSLPTEEVA